MPAISHCFNSVIVIPADAGMTTMDGGNAIGLSGSAKSALGVQFLPNSLT